MNLLLSTLLLMLTGLYLYNSKIFYYNRKFSKNELKNYSLNIIFEFITFFSIFNKKYIAIKLIFYVIR
jgi:hypothetical protein